MISEGIVEALGVGALGAAVAGVVRIAVIVWPPAGAKLPDPSTVPGLPNAGPASPKTAHAVINRKKKG